VRAFLIEGTGLSLTIVVAWHFEFRVAPFTIEVLWEESFEQIEP